MSTNTLAGKTGPFRMTGGRTLAILVAFFGITFAVNGVMIYEALSTFGGLETADAYRRGLAYNERIAAAVAQDKLGWQSGLDYEPSLHVLRFSLRDAGGEPLSGLRVVTRLGRPATDRLDRKLDLEETKPGVYEAMTGDMEPGAWAAQVDVSRPAGANGAAIFQTRRRLWLKP